jgi:biopolymer transport protein ExbB/TolQ
MSKYREKKRDLIALPKTAAPTVRKKKKKEKEKEKERPAYLLSFGHLCPMLGLFGITRSHLERASSPVVSHA